MDADSEHVETHEWVKDREESSPTPRDREGILNTDGEGLIHMDSECLQKELQKTEEMLKQFTKRRDELKCMLKTIDTQKVNRLEHENSELKRKNDELEAHLANQKRCKQEALMNTTANPAAHPHPYSDSYREATPDPYPDLSTDLDALPVDDKTTKRKNTRRCFDKGKLGPVEAADWSSSRPQIPKQVKPPMPKTKQASPTKQSRMPTRSKTQKTVSECLQGAAGKQSCKPQHSTGQTLSLSPLVHTPEPSSSSHEPDLIGNCSVCKCSRKMAECVGCSCRSVCQRCETCRTCRRGKAAAPGQTDATQNPSCSSTVPTKKGSPAVVKSHQQIKEVEASPATKSSPGPLTKCSVCWCEREMVQCERCTRETVCKRCSICKKCRRS